MCIPAATARNDRQERGAIYLMEVLNIVFLILPLVLIMWLANYAERLRTIEQPNLGPRFFAYGLVVSLYLSAIFFAALMSLAVFALQVNPDLSDA